MIATLERTATPTVDIVLLNPDHARRLLRTNTRNRPIKKQFAAELARRLRIGEWRLTWDAIAVDTEGRVLNGQHRLHAIVDADRPAAVLLVTGLPPETQDVGDSGIKRSVSDQLHLHGEPYHKDMAAITRIIRGYIETGFPTGKAAHTLTTPRALELLDRYPEMRDAGTIASRYRIMFSRSSSACFAALWFLFSLADREAADTFADGVIAGVGLEAGEARSALRNRLIAQMRATTTMAERVQMVFTIRAWNAWRVGRRVSKFQYRVEDPLPAITGVPPVL